MMPLRRPLVRAVVLFLAGLAVLARAQLGPQDNWVPEVDERMGNTVIGTASSANGSFSQPWGIAVDRNAVYVADSSNSRLQILAKDGTWIRNITGTNGLQFARTRGLAVDEDNIYTTDIITHRVQVCTKAGAYVHSWGGNGSAPGQFIAPHGIAVDSDHVYVADTLNHRVVVFTKGGVYVRHWGGQGAAAGQFESPQGIAVDDGFVYVIEVFNGGRVQVFTKAGVYVRGWALPTAGGTSGNAINCFGIAVDAHNVYTIMGGRYTTSALYKFLVIYDKLGNQQASLGQAPLAFPAAVAVDNPYFYVSDFGSHLVLPFRRYFRTLGPAVPQAIPLADVVAVSQRPGTSIVDVDFKVVDPDTPVLSVHAAAFVATNTAARLTELVPMRSLVEGTGANLGTNVAAGVVHRLSWDMAADDLEDRIGGFGDMKFAILARDGRPLVDLHFLSIPAVGARPSGVISRDPLLDPDFLPVWFWLVAADDPGVEFFGGRVYQAGTSRGVLFAEGTSTTAAGRDFLFARMNVRQATPGEYTHAREATTPGSVTLRDPRRQPPPAGYKVNEFNFVTSPTNGVWVVPLAP